MEASDSALRGPAADSSREPLLAGALLLSLAFAAIGYNPYNISSDAAMYLQCGELILAGQVPYVDFIDLNPPLIMYLNTIPAWIANAAGTHPIAVFNVMVILATGASMLATHRIVSRAEDPGAARMAGWLAAGIAAVTLGCVLQKQQGQREHLFFLAYAPFLVLRWARGAGARVPLAAAILIGAVAGIMAALKPHFVFIAAIPEIARMFQRRGPKPWQGAEIWSALAVVALYVAHFFFLPAAMKEDYWRQSVKFVAECYSVYNASVPELILQPLVIVATLAALAIVMLRASGAGSGWRLARDFAAASLASAAMYFVQFKGWTYQAIPAAGLALLACAPLAVHARFSPGLGEGFAFALAPAQRRAAYNLGAALALIAGCALLAGATPENRIRHPLAVLIRAETQPGDSVLVFSTGVDPGYPALTLARRSPGSRYLWHFPIASFRRGRYYETDQARYSRQLEADVAARRPKLIVIETAECQGCAEGFSLLAYLESHSPAAELLRQYVKTGEINGALILKRAAAGP